MSPLRKMGSHVVPSVVAPSLSSSSVKVTEAPVAAGWKPWKILVPAAVVIAAALIGGGLYFRFRPATPLTEKDIVVLADFENTTGDPVFDGALKQALAVQLGQSRNTAAAKQDIPAALKLAPGRDVKLLAALTLARVGETARAKAIIEELEKNYPSDTLLKVYWLPTTNAAIELSTHNPGQALVFLEAAAPYELGAPPQFSHGTMYPAYIRGQVQLMAGNGTAAALEFQKFLEHKGVTLNYPLGALAHLDLARSYALSGDTAKARTKYQDFFTLWKDADHDIPILKEAKAEYERLR